MVFSNPFTKKRIAKSDPHASGATAGATSAKTTAASTKILNAKTTIPANMADDPEGRAAWEALMRHRRARRRKKFIRFGLIAAIVVLAIGVPTVMALLPKPEHNTNTGTALIERKTFTDIITTHGVVRPVAATVVTPEIDGIIQNVSVQEGSNVKKGDLLFTIKNDRLDKVVREAQQQLRAAQTELDRAKEALANAEAGIEPNDDPTAGAHPNAAQGTTATDPRTGAVDTDITQSLSSRKEAARVAVQAAQIALENAQESHKEALENANKRKVVSPCNGSIVVMNAQNGAGIGTQTGATAAMSEGAGSSLITIADLSKMTVTVQVNEIDITKIKIGQKATATFSALPDVSCEAIVTRIATVANNDGSAGPEGFHGRDGQVVTYAVTLLIEKPAAQLKPGMTTSVEILVKNLPDVLCVPLQAVTTDDTGSFVTIAQDSGASEKDGTSNNGQDKAHALAGQRVKVKLVEKNSRTAVIEADELQEGMSVQLWAAE